MKSSKMNSKKKHGLKGFILVIGACLAVLAAGSGVNAASCIDLADIPLDALEQAAPGLIMFVLDDSGSMDWSFMTPPGSPGESDGLFKGYYYVFSNPGDDVYNAPNLEDNAADRMIWMSQWSGYNGMYYNPGTEYTPWPTFGNADIDYPRSSPTTVGNTLNMTETNLWHQWGTVGVVVDNDDVGYSENVGIPTPGTWVTYGTGWNGNSRENSGAGTVSAQWEASAATGKPLDPSILYDVQVRWAAWRVIANPQYEVWDGGFLTTTSAPMNQAINSNTWMTIATDVSFTTGIGIVKITDTVVTGDWQVNADAVQFVPKTSLISDVARRHYFVQNATGTYLVNLFNGVIEYYRVNLVDPTDNREVVTADKLVRLTDVDASAAGIVTGRTYLEECQNFANWYSFYRRRELAAKNAIAKSMQVAIQARASFRSTTSISLRRNERVQSFAFANSASSLFS